MDIVGGGSASLLSLTSPTFCRHLQCLEAPCIVLNISHVVPLLDKLPRIFALTCPPCLTYSNHMILFDLLEVRAFLNLCGITSKLKERCDSDGNIHNTSREESFN